MREQVKARQARGHQVELLTTRDARGIEPGFSPSLLGAVYSPLRSQADPQKATRAFATLAERRGARLLTHSEVSAIEPRSGSGWTLRTTRGAVVADALVLAAGAWCGPLGAMLDLEIPIVPVRGQMWATAPVTPGIFQTISSAQSAHSWGVDPGEAPPYRRSARADASHVTCTVGSGATARSSSAAIASSRLTTTPDPAGIEVNRAHAAEVLPFVVGLPIARTWAGLMPFPLDGKPLIGRIAERDNLWIVSGLASSGFGRGPMAGKLLADYLHTTTPAAVLAEADPARRVRELTRM